MTIAAKLQQALGTGIHRIGQIEIQRDLHGHPFVLCHADDIRFSRMPGFGKLALHQGPAAARDLSTYSDDGTYRFSKSDANLRRGWAMALASEQELRQALDHFYPAAAGLWLAFREQAADVQNLRDKLNRQTGMYRSARFLSDAGAQQLVRKVCGPEHRCAKRILWQIDPETPLEESEASRFNGIIGDVPVDEAIPLLCREACNHFVSEARKASKAEHELKKAAG